MRIYHFLSRALGEGVAIAQIVDFDISDEITILGVDVSIQAAARRLVSTTRRTFGLRMTGQHLV